MGHRSPDHQKGDLRSDLMMANAPPVELSSVIGWSLETCQPPNTPDVMPASRKYGLETGASCCAGVYSRIACGFLYHRLAAPSTFSHLSKVSTILTTEY